MKQGHAFRYTMLATTVATLAFAAPAFALTTKSAPLETDAKGYQAGIAECADDEQVISGGFVGGGSGQLAVVNRATGARAWKVRGVFQDDARVYAYCSSKLRASHVRVNGESGTGSDRAGQVVDAKCPSGTSVVSGGWSLKPRSVNDAVYTSMPVGQRTWQVRGVNNFSPAISVSSFAYCLDERAVATRVSKRVDVADDGGSRDRAKASCRSGTELLGGGFDTQPEPDFYNEDGPDTFFDTSARAGARSWAAAATNYSGFEEGTIQAFATCLG